MSFSDLRSLELQQCNAHRTGACAAYASVASDDAMRRNKQRERCGAHRCRDAAMRTWPRDRTRDIGVRNDVAKLQRCDARPRVVLELGALQQQRKVEPA